MANRSLNELISYFGPLGKSLTDSIVYSLEDQLHSIEESFSPEILESVRVDVGGATRFGVHDGQLTKRTRVAKFSNLHALDVKVFSPKGNCRLELTSTCGPYLALVEVKQANDVAHCLMLLSSQPKDFIPITAVKALVVVTAFMVSIDELFDILDELEPLLRRQEASDGGQHDHGAMSREEAAARRQQRRAEREERKRVRRSAWEAALQEEISRRRLSIARKKLRMRAIGALLAVLLAVLLFYYRDKLPYWAGRKAYDIEGFASRKLLRSELNTPAYDREYYQLVVNETRVIFHYVADWLEHVGLKNEQRTMYYKHLRTAADAHVAFLDWHFDPLTHPSSRHLTFKGDPRDVDKLTQLMLNAVDPLVGFWTSAVSAADKDTWDQIREEYGPRSLEIADDIDGSLSFWKGWSMALVLEQKPFYRFLEQNGFSWPPGGRMLEFIVRGKDEVPYIRHV